MGEIWEFVRKELFSPVLAIILGQIIISVFAKFAKLKMTNKLLPARTVIWKCPYIKSQKEKYVRFLLELLLVVLTMLIIETPILIVLARGMNFKQNTYEWLFRCGGVVILIIMMLWYNKKASFKEMFGHKDTRMLKERVFLNVPFILLILMYIVIFTAFSEMFICILGFFYLAIEIASFFSLDGKPTYKYERARVYLNNYLKYNDILSNSIREERKWLCFTYSEYGKEYEACVLKSTVERVEYYN